MEQEIDALLAVYLPVDAHWPNLPFKAPAFTWQGVSYPQGDPEGSFGQHFKLTKRPPAQPYCLAQLPLDYQQLAWQPVQINGPGLYIHYSSLMETMEADEQYSLQNLLTLLVAGQPRWVIAYLPGYDQLDEVLPGDIPLIMEKIAASLTSDGKGYLCWGSNNN